MSVPSTAVVFIHGLWLPATSWQPWMDLFAESGYQSTAPLWPGEAETIAETRIHPERQAGKGLAEIINHFAAELSKFDTKPIVVGHSVGGLIAQALLGRNLAAAAIAIDPAQIKGVLALPLAQLKSAFPALGNPRNRGRAITLTQSQFRYAFGNAISEHESNELHDKWMIPSPVRPLFEAAVANFNPSSPAKVNTGNATRGPLLLMSGTKDHTVPDAVTRATYKQYRKSSAVTELQQFDRGHSLTVDSGWRELAHAGVAWLQGKAL